MARAGTKPQREQAVAVLQLMKATALIADADGILPLLALLRDGTNAQKDVASKTLYELAFYTDAKKFQAKTLEMLHLRTAGDTTSLYKLARWGWRCASIEPSVLVPVVTFLTVLFLCVRTYAIVSVVDTARGRVARERRVYDTTNRVRPVANRNFF